MQLVCDLEIHSRFARAVSKNMNVNEIARWSTLKGIDVVGTGDITHPTWLAELKEKLEDDGTGLFRRKGIEESVRFILTGEVSSIYSQGGKGRRIHTMIVLPSFEFAEKLNEKFSKYGKLISDGRPVLGLSAKQVLKYVVEVNEEMGLTDDLSHGAYTKKAGGYIIPAHVWTPWFGLYGSKSGFDSIADCFEELTPHVRAIETGLSSDLSMNWRLSANDNLALVSFSDAHSAPNLLREATAIQVPAKSFADVSRALQNPIKGSSHFIDFTLEFFPEEGKYHYDGIADQKLRLTPQETLKLRQTNPVLAKKVTVGVLSRVEELADRPLQYKPSNRPQSVSMIPLQEIIAGVLKVGKQSKKVQVCYHELVMKATEFDILVRLTDKELLSLAGETLAQAILNVRKGRLEIQPGYDGIYGIVRLMEQ